MTYELITMILLHPLYTSLKQCFNKKFEFLQGMQLDIFQNRKKEMMIALIKYENSRLTIKEKNEKDKW